MSIYSRLDRIAADVEKLNKQVKSVSNAPQSQRTSVEGGSIDFNDADGNLMAVFGGQDDGSTTVRHVDGPVPPIPSGLAAHVDGPIIQVTWDGTFEDGVTATHDWSHLEVIVVGPSNEQLTATINDVMGASTSVAATVSGEWTVVARSVSRAEKRSLDGDAGTVDVEIVGLSGAIEAAVGSANGKNTVHYSEFPPSPEDEGIAGDTWWVGQVGRPEDIVQATNLVFNPSFEIPPTDLALSAGLASATQSTDSQGIFSGTHCLSVVGASSGIAVNTAQIAVYTSPGVVAGEYLGWSWSLCNTSGVGLTVSAGVNWYNSAGTFISSEYQSYRPVPTSLGRMSSAFLAPVGTYRARMIVRFRAANGTSAAPANFSVLSDAWMGVVAASQASALDAVATYFDGDTESGITENDPHYRWSGTPHASTSLKYLPAIPSSGSDAWNITEQWQYTSSGWAAVELSHQVIATVDLGKATVGELDGIRITGQSIRGQQLSGDAIDGKVITGGTYRTSEGSGSWSDDGLFIAQPDGTSMVRFPTDGSPLSLTASDVQIDRASVTDLDLSYGSVRSGGQVTLASGVTAPTSPPELTTGWQKFTSLAKTGAVDPDDDLPADWLGLGYWAEGSGHWVRAVNVLGAAGDMWDRLETYDYTTGEVEQAIPTGLNPSSGVTVIGDVAYTLGVEPGRPGQNWVRGFDLNTGERVTRWEFTRFPGGAGGRFALGNNGTNIVIAGITPARTLYVLRYNPATGAQVGSDWTTPTGDWTGGQDLLGVHVSGSEVTILPSVTARIYTVSGNTLVRKLDAANANGFAGWNNPNKNGAGFVMRTGLPYVVDGAGGIYVGSPFASDTEFQVCFTWFNGTNETTPSAVASTMAQSRSALTVSFPSRAGMQKRVYLRAGGSAWSRYPVGEAVTAWSFPADASGGTSANPPTTNTFPAATPAVLKSSIGGFQVRGDGSGSWGPLTFTPTGTMTGLPVASGVVVNGAIAGSGNNEFTVNLPPGKFTTPPVVTYTTASPRISPAVDQITATSFRVRMYNLTNLPAPDTTIQWIAVSA